MKILRPISITGGVLVSSSVPFPVVAPGVNPDPALWVAGTTYALEAEARVDTRRYRSRVSGNLGNAPATSPDQWMDIGPVNRLGMFDGSLGTATTAEEQIVVTIAPDSYVDTISLMGVDAETVRIQTAGSPHDETISMVYPRAVSNMYEYRFEPFEYRQKALFLSLPVGSGVQHTITISNPGGVARCGMCIAGLVRKYGGTEYGLELGIKDYSIKTVDRWGGWTLEEGGFSDRVSLTADIPNNLIDSLHRTFAQYRAKPVVWIASELWESAQVYGSFRDFGIVIPNAVKSKCRLEIEGFTYA